MRGKRRACGSSTLAITPPSPLRARTPRSPRTHPRSSWRPSGPSRSPPAGVSEGMPSSERSASAFCSGAGPTEG
eukprot:2620059-Rhodomonas_salina.1